MASKIQLRRDTAANWTTANPVLAQGEAGFETDTKKLKIGNGTDNWTTLTYVSGGGGGEKIEKGNTSAEVIDTGSDGRFVVTTEGAEALRVDASRRLLVGTSTSPSLGDGQYSKLHVIGNTNSASGDGFINIGRGVLASSGLTAGTGLGSIQITDSAGAVHASIGGLTDGTTGANDYPGRLTFSTCRDGESSPTERMRIANNGAASHFAENDTVVARSSASAGTGFVNYIGYHSATNNTSGTQSYFVTTNGDVKNTNNSYGAISDIKLKENIIDATSQWNDLKALQVRKYNFKKETGHETHTQIGLVAQEAELVSPGLVTESPDRDAEGNDLGTVTKSVNYSVLYMKAIKTLQEAMERIETLEAKVAALEGV